VIGIKKKPDTGQKKTYYTTKKFFVVHFVGLKMHFVGLKGKYPKNV
jgi:hypothetical protein